MLTTLLKTQRNTTTLTRSLLSADISATQSAKFLELVWAAIMGWLVFSDVPALNTIAGGLLISVATVWVARRESRQKVAISPP
jgi:drug/metabolite transporter (DMT)-like permease